MKKNHEILILQLTLNSASFFLINMKNNINQIKEFISSTENFWKDYKIKFLDKKHKKILKIFEKKYKKNLDNFATEITKWSEQTNLGSPYQFNKNSIIALTSNEIEFLPRC